MKAKDIEKLLTQNGWEPVRQIGSHKMFKKQGNPHTIAVPFHNKDIPTGTLHSILKQAGLK